MLSAITGVLQDELRLVTVVLAVDKNEIWINHDRWMLVGKLCFEIMILFTYTWGHKYVNPYSVAEWGKVF